MDYLKKLGGRTLAESKGLFSVKISNIALVLCLLKTYMSYSLYGISGQSRAWLNNMHLLFHENIQYQISHNSLSYTKKTVVIRDRKLCVNACGRGKKYFQIFKLLLVSSSISRKSVTKTYTVHTFPASHYYLCPECF